LQDKQQVVVANGVIWLVDRFGLWQLPVLVELNSGLQRAGNEGCVGVDGWRLHLALSMNSPVIANEVTQSMHSEVMDRRATLAMTKLLFKVRVRYRAGYGGLAMTKRRSLMTVLI